ncbi:MAG: nucleotide exchange factor GrpE [Saprospiraceae bacterium]|nr:nucleotide exchange factor GrpE [Saprospiraceae bacterium]
MQPEDNKVTEDQPIDDNLTMDQDSDQLIIDVASIENNSNDEISKMKAELTEQKDKFLRLYAEFDNYKRRTVREKLDLIHTASKEVLFEILPVVDDLERARKLAEDQGDEAIFPEGIRLVYQKLMGVLKSKGVEAMESNGKEFDANDHEAITEIPAPDESMKGKIIDTVEKGYKIHDKILRFAKVVVGK